MSVAQLAEHVATNLKELVARELVVDAHAIFVIDLVPVETILLILVGEIAIVLVDDVPKGIEIALGRVVVLLVIDARDGETGKKESKKQITQPP